MYFYPKDFNSPIDNLMKNGSVVFISLSILVDQNIS